MDNYSFPSAKEPKKQGVTTKAYQKIIETTNAPIENYFDSWMEERDTILKEKDKHILKLKKANEKMLEQLKKFNFDLNMSLDTAKIKPKVAQSENITLQVLKDRYRLETESRQKTIGVYEREIEILKQQLNKDTSVDRVLELEKSVFDAELEIVSKTKKVAQYQRDVKRIEKEFNKKNIKQQEEAVNKTDRENFLMRQIKKMQNRIDDLEIKIEKADELYLSRQKYIGKMNENINYSVKVLEEKESTNEAMTPVQPTKKIKLDDLKQIKEENESLQEQYEINHEEYERKIKTLKNRELELSEQFKKKQSEFRTQNHKLKELQSIIKIHKMKSTSQESLDVDSESEEDDTDRELDEIRKKHREIFTKQKSPNKIPLKFSSQTPGPNENLQKYKSKIHKARLKKGGMPTGRNICVNRSQQLSPVQDLPMSNLKSTKSQREAKNYQFEDKRKKPKDINDQFEVINSQLDQIANKIHNN